METEKDQELWKLAKKRVRFRRHLYTYVIVNAFFWVLWAFDGGNEKGEIIPWPLWSMTGWGIGLLFDYLGSYKFTRSDATEKEYHKLKNERES